MKVNGKCRICEKSFSNSGISRHITNELKKAPEGKNIHYHLKITGGPYFLHLLASDKLGMADLDDFLRDIWLDCCGHLSDFIIPGQEPDFSFDLEYKPPKIMGASLKKVMHKGFKCRYVYDWGSSTELNIVTVAEYSLAIKTKDIVLLSRNEPFEHKCEMCKKDADYISLEAMYDIENPFYCEDCTEKRSFPYSEEMCMPITNSPRMGVCAYTDDTEPRYPFKLVEL